MNYWRIKNKGKGRGEVLIYEQIGEGLFSEGLGAKQFAQDLKNLGPVAEIDIRINSPGGSVFEGLAIFNLLKTHQARKTVYIDGIAASIASVIAMSGDEVIMPDNATMFIHNPMGGAYGYSKDLRKTADELDKIKTAIMTAYRRTGLDDSDIAQIMEEETLLLASEAKDLGFADTVVESIPMAALYDKTALQKQISQMTNQKGQKNMNNEIVKNIFAIGKEYKMMDLAQSVLENGGNEETMRQEVLARIKKGAGDNGALHLSSNASSKNNPFNSLGEQLMAVVQSTRSGRMDNRLMEVRNAATGASEAVPSDGGFLVQSDFTTELMDEAIETSVLAPRCRTLPVGSNSNGMEAPIKDESSRVTGSRWGGVQVYRVNESGEGTPKKPKFGKLSMKLEKLMGICYLTDELLSDATLMEAFVKQAYSEEMGFVLDDEIIRGVGAGQCLGIMNSNALVTVSKETGQLAKTIEAMNLYKMFARIPARLIAGSEWYINPEIWPQIFNLNSVIGAGGAPLFYNPGGIAAAPNGYLLGRPIVPIEQASELGTKGDITLANMKEYVLIEKGGLKFDQSIHVEFLKDEVAFRFIVRNNGQPRWKSSITPYKADSSFKVSPFVTLETRA